jgi:hypothetical protein
MEAAPLDESHFRTVKHLLATGARQVHSEAGYYRYLVLRLMGACWCCTPPRQCVTLMV